MAAGAVGKRLTYADLIWKGGDMQPKDDLGAISMKGHHGNGRNGASQNVEESQVLRNTIESLRAFAKDNPSGFGSVLLDPPWRFTNRTGKMAPEHRRLHRYSTLKVSQLAKLPMGDLVPEAGHIYLWCPNALLGEGLHLLEAWGFAYKTNLDSLVKTRFEEVPAI